MLFITTIIVVLGIILYYSLRRKHPHVGNILEITAGEHAGEQYKITKVKGNTITTKKLNKE